MKSMRSFKRDTGSSLASSRPALISETALMRTRLTKSIFQHMGSAGRHDTCFHHFLGKFFGQFGLYMFKCGLLVLTEVVWFHHSFVRFEKLRADIPEGSPNYWWKLLVPPLAYGAKHAILLQLAFLPLTMARHLLALLSNSHAISKVIPFEHMTQLHVFLGYIFCVVTLLASLLFFVFWGKVCADFKAGLDPVDLCTGLTSEIMLTGYGITFATLVVLLSARFRHKLRFEVFYALHHLVFAMYFLSLAHTLDSQFRNGKRRSQTYTWVTASLLIYLSDRLWTCCCAHHRVSVRSMVLAHDASVLSLSLERPNGFQWRAGQHAFLQVPAIDCTWHPFSVSSEPSSREVRFLIEVKSPGSWTHKLAALSENADGFWVNLMGGFGSSNCNVHCNQEVLAVGTGTGIVPMVSLMLERKRRLLMLNKRVWLDANSSRDCSSSRHSSSIEQELEHPRLRYLQLMWRLRQVQKLGIKSTYLRSIKRQARRELLHPLVDLGSCWLILAEVWLSGTMLSWAAFPGGTSAQSPMGRFLHYTTVAATALYAALSLYRWVLPHRFVRNFWNVFDFFAICGMVGTLVAWWEVPFSFDNASGALRVEVRVAFSLWRIWWLWCTTRVARYSKTMDGNVGRELLGESSFRLIWSCRSADVILGCLPEFEGMMRELQDGLQTSPSGVRTFLSVELCCTDNNPSQQQRLKEKVRGTLLEGSVRFGRPDLHRAIYQVMRRQLADGLNRGPSLQQGARSLVMFCGSPSVGRLCMQYVEEANLLADALAFYDHKLNFQEESMWSGGQLQVRPSPTVPAEDGGHCGSVNVDMQPKATPLEAAAAEAVAAESLAAEASAAKVAPVPTTAGDSVGAGVTEAWVERVSL